MLAFADQLSGWKEFPKGLHVMLVDQDLNVINDLKCKLDSCGYSVTCYTKGEEALQALEDKKKIFHVVVVDATRNDTFDGFMVVAAAKHLTTIMMASTENMNIMMQGIAAGASEFLQKPLSEERLKNIWQHVVRKALGLGHLVPPAALSPLAIDCKFNTTPKPNVGNSASDGCHDTSQMSQEDGNSRDESSATHELFFHEDNEHHIHNNSSFMGVDGKDDFDTFLCSTPPQLEHSCTRIVPTDHDDMELMGSPSMSASREFDMKTDLKEMHDYFDDCDNYFHIKSEVDRAMNNSVVLNEHFDSKSQIDSENFLLISDDDQSVGNEGFVDTKTCNDLQLNDRQDNLDDIIIGGGFLDETMDENPSMRLDCLDDEEFQQAGEEALLTAVVKVEKKSARNPQCSVGPSMVNTCNDNGKNMHRLSSTGNLARPNSERRFSETQEELKCRSDLEQNCCTKGRKSSNGKKKMKVDWTPELHRQFVQAVEQLGVDKAIPSRILELMGVKCLTRHNIASHLQKYRSHRKHVQAREAETGSWNQRCCHTQAAGVAAHDRPGPPLLRPQLLPSRPAARPPPTATSHPIQMRAAFSVPSTPVLHVWGHPTADPSLHFWPAWPPPGCQLDAWGNPFYPAQPILRVPLTTTPSVAVANLSWRPSAGKSSSFHPPKEMVISAINEVLQNPYVPLPLGLKSPSLESVVCELQRQGISMAPTPTSLQAISIPPRHSFTKWQLLNLPTNHRQLL